MPWYHYAVGSVVTLVAIFIAFFVGFNFCQGHYTDQAGVLVRDIIPITIPDWHKPKKAAVDDEASYVSDATKEVLWESLLPYFNLPVGFTEGETKKLKEWIFKKMAVQFQT